MPVDANIALGIQPLKIPTAGEVMSLRDLATRSQINETTLEDKQLELKQKNALMQVMTAQGATDPGTGMLTPQGISAITQINPKLGQELGHQQQTLTLQRIAIDDKFQEVKRQILTGYVNSYQNYLQTTGGNVQEAEKLARQDAKAAIEEGRSSGHFASRGISNKEFSTELPPPETARAIVSGLGGSVPTPPKLEHTTAINPETRKLGLYDSRTGKFLKDASGRFVEAPPNQTMIRAEMDTKGDYTKTGEDFLNTLPIQQRNLVKKVANYEVDPKTFSAQQGQRERMLSWASQYDPNFDQKEYNSRFQAVNKFNTGPQGNTVRSLNVAIQHMDTARKLGDALNNKDMTSFNAIANEFAKQTGSAKPTNFESVKDILADEVVKGVLGAAGGVEDRRAMASKIKASSSPAQLHGALDSWTELLSGQVEGLRTQYEASTGRKDFDQKLNPRTREAIEAVKGAKIREFATEADAESANLKPGTKVKIGGKTGTWH